VGDRAVHQCQCAKCEAGNEVTQRAHHQLNVLMSRLNERERRWLAAMEANKLGHGGTRRLQEMTGLDINTIRRGRRELETDLVTLPKNRIRAVGGGRKRVEKKQRP
jgi:hypothetical protein